MRRGLKRSRWLGWMALVAVWLTALAPTVSRTAQAAFVFPDLGAWCESLPSDHHGMDDDHRNADGACGYCTLFAQTPALGGTFFIASVLPLPGPLPVDLPVRHAVTPVALVHASPRGPPVAACA